MQKILNRIWISLLTFPSRNDWLYAIGLLIIFALIYLPIGFQLEFLNVEIRLSWLTIIGVAISSLLMPALFEELLFRATLIPHPTESISLKKRWFYSGLSWLLFLFYHLHPFVPAFFRTPAFLLGAGLVGIVCTLAYWISGSIWLPVFLHWLIVVVWLLILGGLRKFQG